MYTEKGQPAEGANDQIKTPETTESQEGKETPKYHQEKSVNGILIAVDYDTGSKDYVIRFPQIKMEDAWRKGVSDQLIRISDKAEDAQKIFAEAVSLAEDSADEYDLYNKVQSLTGELGRQDRVPEQKSREKKPEIDSSFRIDARMGDVRVRIDWDAHGKEYFIEFPEMGPADVAKHYGDKSLRLTKSIEDTKLILEKVKEWTINDEISDVNEIYDRVSKMRRSLPGAQ